MHLCIFGRIYMAMDIIILLTYNKVEEQCMPHSYITACCVFVSGEGARGFRCSYLYHGPKALSEPETYGIDQWSRALQDRSGVHVYIDFHSYGLYWLWPWGYTTGLPPTPDHDDQVSCQCIMFLQPRIKRRQQKI